MAPFLDEGSQDGGVVSRVPRRPRKPSFPQFSSEYLSFLVFLIHPQHASAMEDDVAGGDYEPF